MATLQGFQDLSSLTRAETQALGNESMESQALDQLRIPSPSSSMDFPVAQARWETWVRSWVGKIPWRRAWQPTPVFLPRESHGQRSLAGCRLFFMFLHSTHHLTGCISQHEAANAMKTRSGAVLFSAVFGGLAQVVLIPGTHPWESSVCRTRGHRHSREQWGNVESGIRGSGSKTSQLWGL